MRSIKLGAGLSAVAIPAAIAAFATAGSGEAAAATV
jgi:hypothetical protein